MRIRVVLEIDIDPEAWIEENGCERREVRDSVKSYAVNHVRHSAMIEACDAEVTLK